MQILTHQHLKETSVKYDIALTKLSFFMFSNVLSHDRAKDVVKFCLFSQIFLKNIENKDDSRSGAFCFSKAWSLSFERLKGTRICKEFLLKNTAQDNRIFYAESIGGISDLVCCLKLEIQSKC